MTVRELIERLSQLDPDFVVVISDSETGRFLEVSYCDGFPGDKAAHLG